MASSPDGQPSLAQIAQRLFDDALHNIIHDIVIHKHRDHKLLLATFDPTDKLPHCDSCKLPRLLDPPLAPKVRGAASDPPASTSYCEKKPWSRRAGHDIYDNPFPRSDVTGRPPTKKEREAAKHSNSKKDDNTPASEDATQNGTAPPSPSAAGDNDNGAGGSNRPLEKGEKKVVGVNCYTGSVTRDIEILRVSHEVERQQVRDLARRKAERDDAAVRAALASLLEAARSDRNMIEPMLEAVRAEATLGEICGALREEWGSYTEPPGF